ncbi:MAG: transmission trait enhancer LetE [Legionellaceae bacterium]|nr:transmission trait enhancer LetE [Legionellaceae bacterium]
MNTTDRVIPDIILRFQIEHPTFEECYVFGYECASAEVAENEMPFAADSKEAEYWKEGWWAGFYGDTPLFDMDGVTPEQQVALHQESAINDTKYEQPEKPHFVEIFFKVTGALAATALIGYQLLELVA